MPRSRSFCLAALAGLICLGASNEANAQSPSMHWGDDLRRISVAECVRRAKESLSNRGFSVTAMTRPVAGTSGNVTVLVGCFRTSTAGHVPQRFRSTYILVAAASPDSATAERTRNEVRIDVMR